MNYPDNCIKGIPNSDFLSPDRTQVASHLFHFKLEPSIDNGWKQQSINWEDDQSAIQFTLDQRKEGSEERQFKEGAAILPRYEIDRLNKLATINGRLKYNRQPIQSNSYHGNILLATGVTKHTMLQVAASLALCVSRIQGQS